MKSDPRFTIHNASVQRLDPTFAAPKKKLSHATKFVQSPTGFTPGILNAIKKRGRRCR